MKAIIQRVTKASVSVDGEVVGSINKGLCVLLGISRSDSPKELETMVRKILRLRIFDDDQGKRWNKNVMDKQYEVLCISQFTLMCSLKGNKPDYHESMDSESSRKMYAEFIQQMKAAYREDKIQDGRFGAYMQVHIENDGPVTIPIDVPPQMKLEPKDKEPQETDNDTSECKDS